LASGLQVNHQVASTFQRAGSWCVD